MEYFSDREEGGSPRTALEISEAAWGGIVALFHGYVGTGAFGVDFPYQCPDGRGPTGTDSHNLGLALQAEIPRIEWPLRADEVPSTLAVLELLEFGHRHVAEPIPGSYHSFFGHHHLDFDRVNGQTDYRERVNRILSRNGLAYAVQDDGFVQRLAPPILDEELSKMMFSTGDAKLDALLDSARAKFLSPDPSVRREALEKLWGAWERLKTCEQPGDKKASVEMLLNRAAGESTFRGLLEEEAKALTKAGNTFHIRHSEKSQVELETEDHVDYLFHRLFALIWLCLRAR